MNAASRLRLFRFSLVGALGIGIQLGVLAVLTAGKLNYLPATGLAVEAAVLHNFLWHQRFTWADRAGQGVRAALVQLVRFHLSNGLISIVGNLLSMRLLAGWLRLPVLSANLAAITLCFIANYLASDRWVFLSDCPVAHQQQCPLRERKIDQGRGGGQGQTQPNLRCQQEGRERPELIEHKDSGKQAEKLPAETGQVERDCGQQVQAHWNANRSRYRENGGDPRWVAENVLQQFFDHAQPGKGRDVEAEIQNLNEEKKHSHITVRNRGQILGASEQGGPWRRRGLQLDG